MRYLVPFTLLFFLLNQCIFNTDDKQPVTNAITRIYIDEREYGYSNFPTTIIDTADSLSNFLDNLLPQSSWNYKQTFLDFLNQVQIDFDTEYLLLYRHTETSGSHIVIVREPYIENEIILIEIDRDIPSIGTCDMAYYCFAYRVKKEYTTIKFKIEKMDDVLITIPEDM